MKGLKENQILVVIKEPGQAPGVEPLFDNTLEAFQKAVGGYIETVTIAQDLIIICNEEGRLRGLPFNVEVAGVGFVGTVIAVGARGDEFASLKSKNVPFALQLLTGKKEEITLLDAIQQLWHFKDKSKKLIFEVYFDEVITRTARFGKIWNRVTKEWDYVVQDGKASPGFAYDERAAVSAIMSISGMKLCGATVKYHITKL